MKGPIGILLVNLGTPDAPEAQDVRRYLREFLSDPRVLDINPVGRWLLLNLIILPLRPKRSAAAYRKVWTKEGSPLLVHGEALLEGVRAQLTAPDYVVELAMRYGRPSLRSKMELLRERGCDRVVVFPLYPQYASSSTGSTVELVYKIAGEVWNTPFITVVPPFYEDPRFVDAFATVAAEPLEELDPDHALMSFHGLPERHVIKSDPSGAHCLRKPDCCDRIVDANRNCYRAQCFATARALAKRLEIDDDAYDVTFQSRLGRDPWIQPHTDKAIEELAAGGKKRLAVFCPAFVADCLETLEEIGMEGKKAFEEAGGDALALIPSLNSHPAWVDAAVGLIRDAVGRPAALPASPAERAG